MRKRICLLTMLLIIVLVTTSESSKIVFKNYLSLTKSYNDEEVYDTVTTKITDINQLLNNEISGFIYFGRDTCPNCLQLNGLIKEEYAKNEDLLIYKFDTDYWRSDENFTSLLDKYAVNEIPMLIYLNGDTVVDTFDYNLNSITNISVDLHDFLYNNH